jgi:hypothetical protein
MRCKLRSDNVLVITPESAVEFLALRGWGGESKPGALIIEIFLEPNTIKLNYCPCHLPEVWGHLEPNCPEYKGTAPKST